jgi:hypothetical protein
MKNKQQNKTNKQKQKEDRDFFLYNDYLDEEILREVIGVEQEKFRQNNCLDVDESFGFKY